MNNMQAHMKRKADLHVLEAPTTPPLEDAPGGRGGPACRNDLVPLEPPPLPPPEEAPGAHGGPLRVNELVRVCSDACQKVSCGVEGRVLRVHGDRVHLHTNIMKVHDVPLSVVKPVSELVPASAMNTIRQSDS